MSATALLNLLIYNPNLLAECADLTPEHFTGQDKLIFSAILNLAGKKHGVDMASICEADPDIRIDYLSSILDEFTTTGAFAGHKARVVATAKRRWFQVAAKRIGQMVDTEDIDEAIEQTQAIIHKLQTHGAAQKKTWQEWMQGAYTGIEERLKGGKPMRGIPSGWPDLDRVVMGWRRGKLYYAAGRPGMGKTSWLGQTAIHAAKNGFKTAIFSLEMQGEDIINRLLAQQAGVSSILLETGGSTEEQRLELADKVVRVYDKMLDYPIYLDDSPRLSMKQIRTELRRAELMLGGLDLTIIDYLGYIKGEGESRRMQVENASMDLKTVAKEFDCAVVSAAQMNRESEKSQNRKPQLSDLRDSGAVEQDGDAVIFLHREDYGTDAVQGPAEFIVRKNRFGPTCSVPVIWHGPTTTYLSKVREQ